MVLICLLHLLVVIHAGLQFILLDRGQLPTCCGCTLLNGLNARLILGHAGFKCLRLAGHGVDLAAVHPLLGAMGGHVHCRPHDAPGNGAAGEVLGGIAPVEVVPAGRGTGIFPRHVHGEFLARLLCRLTLHCARGFSAQPKSGEGGTVYRLRGALCRQWDVVQPHEPLSQTDCTAVAGSLPGTQALGRIPTCTRTNQ